jgi:PPM family protein phosphatase
MPCSRRTEAGQEEETMSQTNIVPRPTDPGIVPLTVIGSALTDTGAVRASNEDSVSLTVPNDIRLLREKGALAVVADGMGGHEGGEVASGMAVKFVAEVYYATAADPQLSLLRAFEVANREIYEYARKHSKLSGMGTTCTAVAVVNGLAYSAHVGDSRAYLVRGEQAYCMTEDHSATMELVKKGMITLAEAKNHEERNVILRAVGTREELEVSRWTTPFPMRRDDRFLLCSDGLYERIDEQEFASVAVAHSPEAACRELIRLAIERVSSDNVSVAILQLCGPQPAPAGKATREVGVQS